MPNTLPTAYGTVPLLGSLPEAYLPSYAVFIGDTLPTAYGELTPQSFFAEGANGLWYDNDPSTWYEDSAMTTLATFGNPIGAWRDKSGNNMHATQSVAGSRPTYGRMPFGGVRNRLTYTEDLTNAVWAATNVTKSDANTLVETATNAAHFVRQSSHITSGNTYTQSVTLTKGSLASAPDIMQITFSGTTFSAAQYANVNVSTGAVELTAGGATCTSEADPNVPGGWRFDYTATATSSSAAESILIVVFCNNNAAAARIPAYAGSTTSDCKVYFAQSERGDATAYQKVVAGWDVTEVGVASVPCPWLDGIDDFLDFTASGGAGLARDVGQLILVGAVNFTASFAASRGICYLSNGLSAASVRASINGSPSGNLLAANGRRLDADTAEGVTFSQSSFSNTIGSAKFSYSDAAIYLRKNGALVASDLTFQTAGNTSDTDSLACYIGRISTSYFGGFLPSVLAIADTNLSDAQLLQLETYMGQQIGGMGL